jgi:tetratricopeptide (TPR) repeat protein
VPDYRYLLASLYRNLGQLLQDLGRNSEAEIVYRNALPVAEALSDKYPHLPDYQRNLADIYESLGSFLAFTNRPEPAVRFYDMAIGIRRKLLADFSRPAYRHDLVNTLYSFARAQLKSEKFVEAAALAEELPRISPDDPAQNEGAAGLLARCASLAFKQPQLAKAYRSKSAELLKKAGEPKKSRSRASASASIRKPTCREVGAVGTTASRLINRA